MFETSTRFLRAPAGAIILALIVVAVGCQSTSPGPVSTPTQADGTPATPEDLMQRAERTSGARASGLFLSAAEGFLELGDGASATAALSRVEAQRLGSRALARYHLAAARLALLEGDVDAARAALTDLVEADLPDPVSGALIRAEVLSAAGRPEDAATALMAVEAGDAPRDSADAPAPDSDAQQLSDAIWKYLGQVDPYRARARAQADDLDPLARGWWALRNLASDSLTLAEQARRLTAWQAAHPDHPAALTPPTLLALATAPGADVAPVQRVALLLPLSGPLGRAGKAVRDAFVASYLLSRDDVDFDVAVYDVAGQPLGSVYEQVLVDGADVMIGPLTKESVAELNGLNPEVPTLALNYLGDEIPAANLLQLGLAIEDEADTLHDWLASDRRQRLLLLHNSEDWAIRARNTLSGQWQDQLTIQTVEDIRTITESVGVAMHVAASQSRHEELEQIVGEKLEFLPRARGDVDAIVALVTRLEASALVPALKYHFADQVPVYATSQIVRGATSTQLRELNGFRISELPWFTRDSTTHEQLELAFDLDGSPFAALYALGVDAFRLAERTPLLLAGGESTTLLGSTGVLEIASDGRIQRHLARTRIRAGALVDVTGTPGR